MGHDTGAFLDANAVNQREHLNRLVHPVSKASKAVKQLARALMSHGVDDTGSFFVYLTHSISQSY